MKKAKKEWNQKTLRQIGYKLSVILLCMTATASVNARDVTFFHISDQHYSIPENSDPKSVTNAEKKFARTIKAMNRLPGTKYPDKIGGRVDKPRGVIITGDLTNGGNKDQWFKWARQWGFKGSDGLLKYPVYESAGNHDGGPAAKGGYVRRQIIKRNRERPAVVNVSENGLHYSWDWDDVHFVQLNEYAGPEDTTRYSGNRAYNRKEQRFGVPAEKSLQFLRQDLASQVGNSKRPIILLQHYGFGDFPFHPWGDDAGWWTEEHALRLWETIEGYNVISILSGHDGSEAILKWNGIPNRHMDDYVRFGVYHLGNDKMTFAQRNSKSGKWERARTQSTQINASQPPELVQGPYLVYNGKPGTMTVMWSTSNGTPCTLKWGDNRFRYEDGKVEVEPYDTKRNLYKHTITDLKSNDCIKYTLKINGKYTPGMFYTPPEDSKKVKFIVAGEQENAEKRNALYKTLYSKIYKDAAYHSILLRPGELVSEPRNLKAWDKEFFSRAEKSRHVRWMQSRMPLAVVPGNSIPKQQLFKAEPNGTGCYSFDYGPAHITALNAEKSLQKGSPQSKWLQQKFKKTEAKWRLVMWNEPENKRTARQFREHLHAITDAWDVDLCIIGNKHAEPVKRNTTTYIATQGKSLGVEIEGDTLECEIFEPDGNVIDTISLGHEPTQKNSEVLVDSYALTKEEIDEYAKQSPWIKGTTPRHCRVTWHENPSNEAVLSWSTGEKGNEHILYYDTKSRNGDLDRYRWKEEAKSKKYRLRSSHAEDGKKRDAYVHHARLDDLEPATPYWFTMVSDGEASREFYFVTAPDGDESFSILAGGDSRSRRRARIKSNLLMAGLLERYPKILALSHGGDYNDNGARLRDWMTWLTDHELTTTEKGRILPVIPTRGNHERSGPGYNDVFDFPGGKGKNYLTTDFGSQLALITLNTEINEGGTQKEWLEQQLRENRPEHRWLLTSQHYPNYPAVKGIGRCKKEWVPLYERYNLDLSLESDGHCLKRTMAIRNDKPDPTGIVYLGEGGLGAPQRKADEGRWYVSEPAVVDRADHVNLLDISDDSLRIRTIMVNGGWVYQDYVISPRNRKTQP